MGTRIKTDMVQEHTCKILGIEIMPGDKIVGECRWVTRFAWRPLSTMPDPSKKIPIRVTDVGWRPDIKALCFRYVG